MKMFEPVADNVIIKVTGAEAQTQGGVILPDIAQEDTSKATVIAVGPGAIMLDGKYCNMQTKPGDIVIYPKMGAKKIEYNDEEFLILRENDILTILTEETGNE
jgi:chaperonin GroES